MNQEAKNGNSPEQQGKSATYKRSNKARNRPVLVTPAQEQAEQEQSYASDSPVVGKTSATTIEADAPVSPTKSRPKFFSTIGRKEAPTEQKIADPATARLARAIRGKATSNSKKELPEPKKQATREVVPTRAAAARPAGSRPASAFKPRHFIGILLYIIVADVAGIYEKNLLVGAKLEKLLFNLGPLPVYLSTVLFLLTLVVLLVILARFDLVPRSLGSPARNAPRSASPNSTRANDAASNGQPTIKQGVKGAHDDLYQEYRQNQRYWQRRDRKK